MLMRSSNCRLPSIHKLMQTGKVDHILADVQADLSFHWSLLGSFSQILIQNLFNLFLFLQHDVLSKCLLYC